MLDDTLAPAPFIRIEPDAVEIKALAHAVVRGLVSFNTEHAGPADDEPLALSARGADGEVVGGLVGATGWQWLAIQLLWVDAAHRGRGVGRALLRRAELEARGRGCTTAMVDTFDFQAPRFYEAEGYTIWGVLEGYPPGHQRFYLRKTLGDHTD